MNQPMKPFALALMAAFTFSAATAQTTKTVTVTNPSAIERTDELVVLSRQLLQKKLGKLAAGKLVQVQFNNHPKVVQYDDLNQDGVWEEAVFLHSFAAGEKAVFTLKVADKPATIKAVVRAYVRQKHKLADESFGELLLRDTMPFNNQPTDFSKQKLPPYLTEGPAWENDKVGFRKYFDVRNANDIWGKVTNRMVLDEVGVDPSNIYHHFSADWGMDILKVGKALGAGALALQLPVNGKDTLIRFGTNVQQTTYTQLANGPVRALFAITYKNWQPVASVTPLTVTEQIGIWGGQYFYENKVTVKGAPAAAKLVTGTIDFYNPEYDTLRTANTRFLYTYGQQSENKDNLGLAVAVPAKTFSAFGHTPAAGSGILNTYTAVMNIAETQPAVYRYYAAWEKTNPAFAAKSGFEQFIQAEAAKMDKKLLIN